MYSFNKKFYTFAIVGILSVAFASSAFAEASNSERSVTGFFRRLFNYPVKATQETAGMTVNTLQNTGEKVVAKTAENTSEVLKGDVAQTGDLVKDNVTGVAETAGQTVSETAQVPVKAAEENTAEAAK